MPNKPAINPDVDNMADRVKNLFAVGTQQLANLQYRLAELAGTGKLDPDEVWNLHHDIVDIWERLYSGTLRAVRDEATDEEAWDVAGNTYSDGRTIRVKIRIEPEEHSDWNWEYNRFLLGDGAVAEHPRGTICYIEPVEPPTDW